MGRIIFLKLNSTEITFNSSQNFLHIKRFCNIIICTEAQ